MPTPIAAANAYATLARLTGAGAAASASSLTKMGAGAGPSFGSLL